MANGVIDRLLRDAVNVHGRIVTAVRRRSDGFEATRDATDKLNLEGKIFERGDKSRRFELHGTKAARKRATLRDRIVDERDDRRGLSRFVRIGREAIAERGGETRDAGEMLTKSVVQIGANALLFSIADTEETALEPFALGDVNRKSDRTLALHVVETEIVIVKVRLIAVDNFADEIRFSAFEHFLNLIVGAGKQFRDRRADQLILR